MSVLVVYYSQARGNTKRIANMIAEQMNADVEAIETVIPYEGSYEKIVDQGQQEVNRGYEPEIKKLKHDLAKYDLVFVGTPTWWYTMAPAVHTFLNENDWNGKKVVPFMTNGGWPGHVINDMKELMTGADVLGEKEVRFDSTGGDHLETPEEEIRNWISSIKKLNA